MGHSINHHKYNNGPADVLSTCDRPRDDWRGPPRDDRRGPPPGWGGGAIDQGPVGATPAGVALARHGMEAAPSATTLEKTTVRKTGCLTAYNKN